VRTPRVYVDSVLSAGRQIRLSAATSLHLAQVLRLRAGDPMILFNGDGRDYSAHLIAGPRAAIVAEVEAVGEPEPPPLLFTHLGLGVSKGERMDFALQKSVELGVSRITPLFTRRGVVQLASDRLQRRMEHWRGVVRAACEQSGRRRLPGLEQASDLGAWLRQSHPLPLLLDASASLPLAELPAPKGAVTILVGPEGGLSPSERASALDTGFIGVRLGPRVLRTETAPLAALAVVQALWGDFRN